MTNCMYVFVYVCMYVYMKGWNDYEEGKMMDLFMWHLAYAAVVFHSHLALSHPIWRLLGESSFGILSSSIAHPFGLCFYPCLLGISCNLTVCCLTVIFVLASLPYSMHFSSVSSIPAGHRCFLSSHFFQSVCLNDCHWWATLYIWCSPIEFMADPLGVKSYTLNSTQGKIPFPALITSP